MNLPVRKSVYISPIKYKPIPKKAEPRKKKIRYTNDNSFNTGYIQRLVFELTQWI